MVGNNNNNNQQDACGVHWIVFKCIFKVFNQNNAKIIEASEDGDRLSCDMIELLFKTFSE